MASPRSGKRLRKDGRIFDYLVERIAYYIRLYRPQVYVHHANNVRSQHGQHQATYIVSMRAIEAAADPTMYPEHGLPAWQVPKVYEPGTAEDYNVAVDTGAYDPIYGDTYQRISDYSRSFHACQGMGATTYPKAGNRYFKMTTDAAAKITDAQQESSFFDGLPYDFDDCGAGGRSGDRGSAQKDSGRLPQTSKLRSR